MRQIAALYVDPRGPYARIPGVECWGVDRDARGYRGPSPVVAHPPCGPWGRLRHLYRDGDRLPRPGEFPDGRGFTVAIDQCAWGHVARKPTWLYVVGVAREVVELGIRTGGTPTHWVSGSHRHRDPGKQAPDGMKICSTGQRRRTPPDLAAWLVELARIATTPEGT